MSEADDPPDVMREALQKLDSIATSLGENPTQALCTRMAETMPTILEQLKGQISLLEQKTVKNEQPTVPVQEKKKSSYFSCSIKSPKKQIQILNPIPTETTDKFSSAMKKKMSELDCKLLSKKDPLDQLMPLIIVCKLSSRLKPDVDLALESVKDKWPLECVVIILHIGAESNMPAVPTATKLLSYSNVIFVDMGFSYSGDILNCPQNKKAGDQLLSYATEFYKNVK